MEKIAFLIIYNHRYDKNIDKLEELYKNSFQHLFHVMPFYEGKRKNVISVFESSYCFQGYIAQAYQHLKEKGFSHFLIIADDLLLNPVLNEQNFFQLTGLEPHQSYISELLPLDRHNDFWFRIVDALEYDPDKRGVEIKTIIPSVEEAIERFQKYSLSYAPIKVSKLIKQTLSVPSKRFTKKLFSELIRLKTAITLKYPLVGAYSDILMIPDSVMPKFVTYCGAFAATDLFVELAIPTALILATDDLVVSDGLKLKGRLHKANDDYSIVNQYNFNLKRLIEHFPKEYLFVHPIKLSKWS